MPAKFNARWSATHDVTQLYSVRGERKYVTTNERDRLLAVLDQFPPDQALFVETLVWSGARISEVLALTPGRVAVREGKIVLQTLKRRRVCLREVALPTHLLLKLNAWFRLDQCVGDAQLQRLWGWHRVTGWRIVKRAFGLAEVSGPAATPRGCRHGFGAAAIQNSIPLNLLQRWLGHARIDTTCIYAGLQGPDELAIAKRMWER